MSVQPKVTKQSATRQQVLELIERLGVGTAIPSERQLSADLGVSRLTVRAALDELAREGYLVRRRGSGTYVQQPKIAQELTITSFSEDMRRRGMEPGSRRSRSTAELAGARLGRFLNVSPSEKIVVVKRLRLADGETMAIETLHIPEALVPGLAPKDLAGSFYELLRDRYGVDDRQRHPGDRADGDERGGVGGARRPAPLAGLPLRADEPRRGRPHGRVRPVRATAATATGSSPSSAAATPERDPFARLLTGVVWCAIVRPWPIGIDQSTHRPSRAPPRPQGTSAPKVRVDGSRRLDEITGFRGGAARRRARGRRRDGGEREQRQQQASKLTVWLQVDAQTGWPDVVAAANTQFEKDHPG